MRRAVLAVVVALAVVVPSGTAYAQTTEKKKPDKASQECIDKLESGNNKIDDCQKAPSPILPATNELIWGALSFVLLPGWIHPFLAAAMAMPHTTPPVGRPGGFLLLLSFLRWRRPEFSELCEHNFTASSRLGDRITPDNHQDGAGAKAGAVGVPVLWLDTSDRLAGFDVCSEPDQSRSRCHPLDHFRRARFGGSLQVVSSIFRCRDMPPAFR